MRIEKEQIHAIELHAVDLRRRGEIQHGIEINGRFSARTALAHQAGPHGIVQFRVNIFAHRFAFRINSM